MAPQAAVAQVATTVGAASGGKPEEASEQVGRPKLSRSSEAQSPPEKRYKLPDRDLVDPCLDGDFEQVFSWEEINGPCEAIDYSLVFRTHHPMRNPGGIRQTGDADAECPDDGKRLVKKCQGVFKCTAVEADGTECGLVRSPHVSKPKYIARREEGKRCVIAHHQAPLTYVDCSVTQELHEFRGGVRFRQEGTHTHTCTCPSAVHLTLTERARLAQYASVNPDKTPMQLLAGSNGPDGKRMSAFDVSGLFANRDRLSYELAKTKRKSESTTFSAWLQEFESKAPGFIVNCTFPGGKALITMCTEFLALYVRDEVYSPANNTNGFVCDAAMKYALNALFIVVSSYSALLHRWVPLLATYSHGQDKSVYAEHFRRFFMCLNKEYLAQKQRTISRDDIKGIVSVHLLTRLQVGFD